MKIRRYEPADGKAVANLFYETVHTVCAGDYTPEQLCAWAESLDGLQARQADLCAQFTLIAERERKIVGFGSIDASGCLDLLFVHKDYLRQGIATALCDRLEQGFSAIKTYASLTAKPFFEQRGYTVTKAQEVERKGVRLKNYEMQKRM